MAIAALTGMHFLQLAARGGLVSLKLKLSPSVLLEIYILVIRHNLDLFSTQLLILFQSNGRLLGVLLRYHTRKLLREVYRRSRYGQTKRMCTLSCIILNHL